MGIVDTQSGKVEGLDLGNVQAFLGIPFAAPPTGELRWRAPVAPDPWTGVRAADEWLGQSWQPVMEDAGALSFAFNARSSSFDEDCLQLNVWTPGLDQLKRPVLVWIHGGGFSSGTGATPLYDGTSLAARGDAVVVTINYRLGALGFLNLNEITGGRIPSTGNEGLQDQVMALRWVSENIDRFGGDPSRVTIFGESAGGMSVGTLMALPDAAGLFHRAIPQSGACSTANPLDKAADIAAAFVDNLGLSANDDIDALMGLDPQSLVDAGNAVTASVGGMVFQPCIDGTVLADLPLDAVKKGAADGIDVFVGAARDEWKLFTSMAPSDTQLDDAVLAEILSVNIDEPAAIIEAYREARLTREEDTSPIALFEAIETDRIFRLPAIHLAEALLERGQASYQYLFTWESPWEGGKLGSPHAIDIGFVFGTNDMSKGSAEFFGTGPAADELVANVQDAWLAFAATGNPSTDALAGLIPYDTERRATAVFGDPVTVADDPLGSERAAWEGVSAKIGSL